MSTQFDPTQLSTAFALYKYRKPDLSWVSTTQVQIPGGQIDGNASNSYILFSDGAFRVDSTASHVVFDITRNAVFNGVNQSGLRTGSVAANTWYSIYAVKEQNGTGFVLVGDINQPVKGNIATNNANYGVNGWEPLGMIRYGNNNATTTGIVKFVQSGGVTLIYESNTSNIGRNLYGIKYAANNATNQLTYTTTFGAGVTDIPSTFTHVYWNMGSAVTTREFMLADTQLNVASGTSPQWWSATAGNVVTVGSIWIPAQQGASCGNSGGAVPATSIYLSGWMDNVLMASPVALAF